MASRNAVFCYFLAVFCFISWKHSIIGVTDALNLAVHGLIFLAICTLLIYIILKLKSLFFQLCQELPDSQLRESRRLRQEQARRIQQHQHNDKTSDYAERVLKPRQELMLQQEKEREDRMARENWRLSKGFRVGGEEDQDVNVDENPNQGARRRRKLLKTVTQDPVRKEAPEQKKVIVLPDEPSADTEGVVKIALRCPRRRTFHRRFLKTWSSMLLLDWMRKTGYHPALYTLCTSYPRKTLLMGADVSLEAAGILTDTLLHVERKEPPIN